MDISKIDITYIEIFNLSYSIAMDIFGTEPIGASAKMQKKIRKWIEKTYIVGESYPPNVMQYVGREVSNKELFEFLKACYDQIQLNGTHKKQSFDKFSGDLAEEVKTTIWEMLEQNVYCGNIRKTGSDAQIDVNCCAGYNRTLTLINASCIPEGKIDCLSFENGSLIKCNNEYKLLGEAENYEEDLSMPFAICFTDAKVDITLFKANEQLFSETPWMHLQLIASNILSKYILPGEYLNEREKELLPLIAEICKLSYWSVIPGEFQSADFSQLKSYIIAFQYNELYPLIENLETEYFNNNIKDRIIKKLICKLNHQKYEPLWRELYNHLVESQAEYPSKAALFYPINLLIETRSNIQKQMEAFGYSGTYPDFVKKGAIRGIHLAESYDMTYFIGPKNKVAYYIHCTEEYVNEHLIIQFICGTELLKKNETAGDIYSCLFNARGRRLFQTVSYESNHINHDGENESDNLAQRIQIAVKRAELVKLTKNERKELIGFDIPWWTLFFTVFIVMGGLFSIFMTIGFMLITAAVCLLFGQLQAFPLLLSEIPWWLLLVLAWVLFGGAMGIITILAKRK